MGGLPGLPREMLREMGVAVRLLGYLDPGSGAMIGGAIAGVGAAVAVAARASVHKLTRLVSPKRRRADSAAASAPPVPSE